MNKEQIIDEAYKNYENKYYKGEAFGYKKLNNWLYSPDLKLSQEEFIDKCKKDPEFSEKWGLKIEERELSLGERWAILEKKGYRGLLHSNVKNYKSSKKIFEVIKKTCDELNIPTKLITLTYNNETIESYE